MAAGGWTWKKAAGTPDWDAATAGEPGRDEYAVALTAPVPGTYALAFRFSRDAGKLARTMPWSRWRVHSSPGSWAG